MDKIHKLIFTLMSAAVFALFGLFSCSAPADSAGRTFYMGFTTYPYDVNPADSAAVSYTTDQINVHGDIIAFHFDNGIPWNEALADDGSHSGYPSAIISDLQVKRTQVKSGHAVYAGLASLNGSRTALAGYRNNSGDSQSLPVPWNAKNFADYQVLAAYENYCTLLIDTLRPDYFNYAIESNSENWDSTDFSQYLNFCAKVYTYLKAKYPSLKLLVSVMTGTAEKAYSNASALMPYTDYVGLSLYPFMYLGQLSYDGTNYSGSTDPSNFPGNWLSYWAGLAPDKKLAVTETGYPAENLDLTGTSYKLIKTADSQWQAQYVDALLSGLQGARAEFVVWWEIRDYDIGWAWLNSMGITDPLLAIWKDTGQIDGSGNARPALGSWDNWLCKPRRP